MKKTPAEEREALKLKEQQSPLDNLSDQITPHTSGLGSMSWQWTGLVILILIVMIAVGYFIFK